MAADETFHPEPSDTSVQPSPHIRLRVDLVVEIADADALTRSAVEHIARDELMPDEEQAHAEEIVTQDAGEALACLVDPFDLVRELPGVELAHASWGSEEMAPGELESFSFLDGADGGLDEGAVDEGAVDDAEGFEEEDAVDLGAAGAGEPGASGEGDEANDGEGRTGRGGVVAGAPAAAAGDGDGGGDRGEGGRDEAREILNGPAGLRR